VSAAVLLNSGPLGILVNPGNRPHVVACHAWLSALQAAGRRVLLPEIADYEVRRVLIRIQSQTALSNLDLLASQLEYLPLHCDSSRPSARLTSPQAARWPNGC
jgi:hypothetical protein